MKTDWNKPIELSEFEKGYKEGLRDAAACIIMHATDLDGTLKKRLLGSMGKPGTKITGKLMAKILDKEDAI